VTTARRTDDAGGGGKKGRPKGSPNREVDQVEAPATACTKCGSTRREPYFNKRVIETAGIDPKTGQGYTAIVYRRTICDCGHARPPVPRRPHTGQRSTRSAALAYARSGACHSAALHGHPQRAQKNNRFVARIIRCASQVQPVGVNRTKPAEKKLRLVSHPHLPRPGGKPASGS
jgi:hypothetical protein